MENIQKIQTLILADVDNEVLLSYTFRRFIIDRWVFLLGFCIIGLKRKRKMRMVNVCNILY